MANKQQCKERWDLDEEGNLDDVVVPDVACFRLERMDHNEWWIGMYDKNGKLTHIDITAEANGVIARRRDD